MEIPISQPNAFRNYEGFNGRNFLEEIGCFHCPECREKINHRISGNIDSYEIIKCPACNLDSFIIVFRNLLSNLYINSDQEVSAFICQEIPDNIKMSIQPNKAYIWALKIVQLILNNYPNIDEEYIFESMGFSHSTNKEKERLLKLYIRVQNNNDFGSDEIYEFGTRRLVPVVLREILNVNSYKVLHESDN